MSILNVSTTAGLASALKLAHAGDTIKLAPGNYSGTVISNLNFGTPVTITSASTSMQAVLVGLKIANSSGLTFSNLQMSSVGSTDPYYAFRVQNSQNISFTSITAHGNPSIAAASELSGFYVTGSSNVTLTNSQFSHLWGAITANNDTGVNISNDTFSYVDKGGVEMGGSSNVNISNNTFTDFQVSAGEHSDAIQIYTAGTTTIASNISITGNTFTRGTGDAAQGIFVQDEVGTLPYHNLTIANNTVLGGMWDSIFVNANVTGVLQVTNNYVASWAGTDMEGDGSVAAATATTFATTSFLGRIALLGNLSGATVTETGNVAQSYLTGSGAAIPTPAGNTGVGSIAAITGALNLTPISAVAETLSAHTYQTVTGNALAGDTGSSLYLADIGIGAKAQTAVAAGSTYVGTYGTLTVNPNGSYTYAETKQGLTVGQVYDDHFTTTVASLNGKATSSTLDVIVTATGVGNGGADIINGGTGTEKISGFGAGSSLTSGTGPDTFVLSGIGASTPTNQTVIHSLKASDIIDLSAVDPNFHIVTKFDGHANELVLSHIGTGNWEIYGDTTGSGTANFALHVMGMPSTAVLTAADFHL